jgi:hypothetical protein
MHTSLYKKGEGEHIKKRDKKEHTQKNHEIRVKTQKKIKKTLNPVYFLPKKNIKEKRQDQLPFLPFPLGQPLLTDQDSPSL